VCCKYTVSILSIPGYIIKLTGIFQINGRTGYVPESFIRQVPAENAKRFGLFDNDCYLNK